MDRVPSWQQEGGWRPEASEGWIHCVKAVPAEEQQDQWVIWGGKPEYRLIFDTGGVGWILGIRWELLPCWQAKHRGGQARSQPGGQLWAIRLPEWVFASAPSAFTPPLQQKPSLCGLPGWGGSKSNLKTQTYLYRHQFLFIYFLIFLLLKNAINRVWE